MLTSGTKTTALQGIEVLQQLIQQGGNRISVMAGGGVNEQNTEALIRAGVKEFHGSFIKNESELPDENTLLQVKSLIAKYMK